MLFILENIYSWCHWTTVSAHVCVCMYVHACMYVMEGEPEVSSLCKSGYVPEGEPEVSSVAMFQSGDDKPAL